MGRDPCILDLRVFGEGVLALFFGLRTSGLAVFHRSSGEFVDRRYAWVSWALSDDVESFGAHITAFYPRPVAEPSPPVPLVARLFGRCVRRRVPPESQLVIFVTERDLRRMAGSGLRSDAEAAAAFARWHRSVPRTRRFGTMEIPSVAVDVEGVEVAARQD